MPIADRQTQLVLAVLNEAREAGVAPLLKTAFVKYLYLLDVYFAEEHKGETAFHWEWRFLHFGPFAVQAAERIDELTASRVISVNSRESEVGDKEFLLYDLGAVRDVPDLVKLGISGAIQLRLRADMHRFRRDISRLLDYVYFGTAPMASASPGDILRFTDCSRVTIDDVRHVTMRNIPPKPIAQARERLRELIKKRKALPAPEQGPFDDVYQRAVELLDGQPLEVGLQGKAKLNVK